MPNGKAEPEQVREARRFLRLLHRTIDALHRGAAEACAAVERLTGLERALGVRNGRSLGWPVLEREIASRHFEMDGKFYGGGRV
jgi:hypothetical protein